MEAKTRARLGLAALMFATNIVNATEIFDIQGSGSASPFDGLPVATEDNVVTCVAPTGFFIQTPAVRSDGDVDTSDGIFVFTGVAPSVAVGDLVDVSGTVDEFFGFTQIDSPVVVVDTPGGGMVPAAVVFDATVPSPDPTAPSCSIEFECYEGMLVEITNGTVTGPSQRFGTDPIAEAYIAAVSQRTFREVGIEFPSAFPSLPEWDGNPEVLELDPDKLGLPNQTIPAGSSFSATGALGFEFGGYELWPNSLTVTPVPLPVPVRARATGEFTVGTLNLFRLFDDVDDPSSMNFQGAARDDFVASTAEYDRRQTKFTRYILDVLDAPDILAVQEAEKIEVLAALAGDIAVADPAVTYTPFLIEGNDIGTIDVGFLVREDRITVDVVSQLGLTETYVNPLTTNNDVLHDRPPLLLEGSFGGGGAPFAIKVMAVHNLSRSGIDDPVQGPQVREKRLQQAQSIAQKIQDLQNVDPAVRLVVIGDFNAFEFTDGYVDAVGRIRGSFVEADDLVTGPDLVTPDLTNQVEGLAQGERYSITLFGSAQVSDHGLTSQGLEGLVSGAEFGRGNADAGVNLINDDTTALRASDHDGLVLFISTTVVQVPDTDVLSVAALATLLLIGLGVLAARRHRPAPTG